MIDFSPSHRSADSTVHGTARPTGSAGPTACEPLPPGSGPPFDEEHARRRRLGELGDEIARLSAHIQAAAYRLLVMIRIFDEGQGWHEEGFRSCARWLSWKTGIGAGAAREKVRVARALAELPALSAALERGRLSYSVARALTRVATPENEEELVAVARHSTAADLERLVRAWRAADRAEDVAFERERHRRRELWVTPTGDGSWEVRGRLDPEVGAVLKKALEAAGEALYGRAFADPEGPSAEARRADALGLVAEAALGEGLGRPEARHQQREREEGAAEEARAGEGRAEEEGAGPTPRPTPAPVACRAERFQVVVDVSEETLEATPEGSGSSEGGSEDGAEDKAASSPPPAPRIRGGPHISVETARRLACDAGHVLMTHGRDGSILDVGRKSRRPPVAQRRALDHRDRRCRFPGCEARFCDSHHIQYWTRDGKTKLENLMLLCRHHHRRVHEGGWSVKVVDEQSRDGDQGNQGRGNGGGGGTCGYGDGRGGAPGGGSGRRATNGRSSRGPALRFLRPDGRPMPEVSVPPPPVPEGEDPADAILNEQRELDIGPDTPTPDWDGHPMDIGWALCVLSTPLESTTPLSTPETENVSAETPAVETSTEEAPGVDLRAGDDRPGDLDGGDPRPGGRGSGDGRARETPPQES